MTQVAGINLSLALCISGCGSDTVTGGTGGSGGGGGSCPAEVDAKLEAMEQVAAVGSARIAALKAATASACAAIAEGLGQSVVDVSDPVSLSLDDLQQVCDVAASAIEAEIQANGGVVLAYSQGYCGIDFDGQSACEAALAIGECEPEPLEERCPAPILAGVCQGGCLGPCVAPAGSDCTGTCQGVCTGSCEGGTCTPASGGGCICDGSCNGACQGQCDTPAPGATCAEVCLGECNATHSSSFCTDELDPPMCNLEPGCRQSCLAQGWFGAACDPGTAYVGGNATLAPLLVENLPALYDASSVTGEAMMKGLVHMSNALGPDLLDQDGCLARLSALVEGTSDDAATLAAVLEAATPVVVAVP